MKLNEFPIATLLILLALTPLLLVNAVLAAEIVAGLQRPSPAPCPATDHDAVIVVPAHNEAPVLSATLDRLKSAAREKFRILVVADNCTDDTARIANASGVTVIERNDPAARGKGHALAFARDMLRRNPPAVVIVLDADCHTDEASLLALAAACMTSARPCQAINLLEAQPLAAPMVQISTFAFLLKNLVRQRGLAALTGGVHLTGTGMCLRWAQFEQADLATSSIVEDVRLGLELARKGARPMLVEQALVWSPPSDKAGTLTQRQRWEGGLLGMARAAAPQAVGQGIRKGDLGMMLSGLDLLIPPLAMLVLLNLAGVLLTVVIAALGGIAWLPAVVMATATGVVGLLILVAWWREGRPFLAPRTLIKLPLYVLWKVPMYLRLARRGAPTDWLQSGRSPLEKDR